MIDPFFRALPNSYVHKTQEIAKHGVPDYFFIINGMGGAMEVKIDGEKPTKLQKYKLGQVERAKGLALTATPATWDDVSKVLTILAHEPSSKERKSKNGH